jgi:hypothetical protein
MSRRRAACFTRRKSYKDAVVEAEVRWSGEIDSGFMMQAEIQCQIGISRPAKEGHDLLVLRMSQSIPTPREAKGVDKLLKEGDWNLIRFEAVGSKLPPTLMAEGAGVRRSGVSECRADSVFQIHPKLKNEGGVPNIRAKERAVATAHHRCTQMSCYSNLLHLCDL